MPIQTVKVYPGIDVDFLLGGEATAAWSPAPVASIVDDPAGGPDGVAGRFSGAFASARMAAGEWKSASVPSGILSVSAIRMKARFLANGNAGTFDLVVTGYVRPTGVGTGSGGAYFAAAPVTITSESASGRVWHDATIGTWAADPATTVAWTASTLRVMSWGAKFEAPPTDPVVNAGIELDQVYLELDFVTIAADIDGVRTNGSAFLRLFRREPELVEITGPMLLGDVDNLETFGIEHSEGPAPDAIGWGPELWRRGAPIVLERTIDILAGTVRVLALNPRQYLTRWWSTFLTDIGHTLDGQGIPLLHSGAGGIQVTRGSVGYLERPGAPPDGVIMAAGENLPKYSRLGLIVEGPGATNLMLNSTFSQGAGNAFDNWTPVESGTGTVTETAEHIGFDEIGLRRSAFLQVGATDASAAIISSDPVSVTGPFRVRVRTKNLFGAAKLAAVIRRASDSFDWNDTTAVFESPAPGNLVGENAGGHRDWHSKLIDPGGAEDITVHVGYNAEAGTAGFIASVTSVEIYDGSPTHIGSDLPTTTTSVTRVDDLVIIDNSEIGRMWDPTSGSFVLGVTPFWNGGDIGAGDEKVFWFCRDVGEGVFEEILYRGGDGVIFRRSGQEAIKAFTPVAGVQFKISVRWVATVGELGLPEYSHEVAVNDVWGVRAAMAGPIFIEPTAVVYVGSNGSIGDDSWADAALCHCDVSPLVLLDAELERRAP